MIRKFHVVVVGRTSKKCTKTCNALAELLFSCVNQLFIDVHDIVMPGAQLTRLEIPNARAKPATGQRGTLLIRTVPVIVTVSGWPTFSISNLAFKLTPLIMHRTFDSRTAWLAAQNRIEDAVYAPNANH